MEKKDFNKEYLKEGAYHHDLKGFKALWYKRNYELLAENIEGNILDIGCGDGRLTDFLDQTKTSVDGFDLSPHALNLAKGKKTYRDLWIGNIMDGDNYGHSAYDFFISSLVLQYLNEKDLENHFEIVKQALPKTSEYRFSFPNTDTVPSPKKMMTILAPLFTSVQMKTITGFIKDADRLSEKELMKRFLDKKDYPVEKSYHYIIKLKK